MDKERLFSQKIAIVTHVYATGPTHALEDFLKGKVEKLLFIGHPFVFAKEKRSHLRMYNKNGTTRINTFYPFIFSSQLISLLRDWILTAYLIIRHGPVDLYIGADCFNAFMGVVLQKMGIVKKTVFYTIDYIPNRFSNPFMNWIYHTLDTFCVKQSDMVWNLSDVMVTTREKKGVEKKYRKKQIVVPMGTESSVKPTSFSKIKRYTAMHMGHLIEKQGLQLVIEAMPEIIKKVPKFHLDIIGGGDYEPSLREMAKKYNLSKHITWYGFVKKHADVERMISQCAFGLAPYLNTKDNYIQFTDPGKVKAYLAAGLPIIITKMTPIAFEIADKKCGFAIEYTKKEMVSACIKLLQNDTQFKQMRENVLDMRDTYRWENIFSQALSKTL